MNRTQFTFYESFYKSIAKMRKKADQADAYNAIARLALYGEEPDMDALPDIAAVALENIIPNVLASNRKAEVGKRGGEKAKRKQNESKTKAKRKQTGSESENENEIEIENEYECITPVVPFNGELKQAVDDWLAYKKEKRQPYKPTGLKNLMGQIRNAAEEFGDSAVANVIRDSMSSNYTGIMFDRLRKKGAGRMDALMRSIKEEMKHDQARDEGVPVADGAVVVELARAGNGR